MGARGTGTKRTRGKVKVRRVKQKFTVRTRVKREKFRRVGGQGRETGTLLTRGM